MTPALLLLADSQLLFRPQQTPLLFSHVQCRFSVAPHVAYLGAANNNQDEYFDLAQSGIRNLVGMDCPVHWIKTLDDVPGHPFDVVVLSGGDVTAGWGFLGQSKVQQWLLHSHALPNSLMVGVSAGAIHMARGCDPDRKEPHEQIYLGWHSAFIAVHEEAVGWPSLSMINAHKPRWDAMGIPMGGGLWVEGQHQYQIGKPCVDRTKQGSWLTLEPFSALL